MAPTHADPDLFICNCGDAFETFNHLTYVCLFEPWPGRRLGPLPACLFEENTDNLYN